MRFLRNLKLRVRLLIAFTLLSLTMTSLVTYSLASQLKPHFLDALELTLVDMSRLLASSIADQAERDGKISTAFLKGGFQKMLTTKFPRWNLLEQPNALRVYVTDDVGKVLFDSKDGEFEGQDFSQWRDIYLTLRGEYGARSTRKDPLNSETSAHFVAAPIYIGGQIRGAISVGKPIDSLVGFFSRTRERIGLIYLASIWLGIGMSFFTAFWISRPTLRLENYVRDLIAERPRIYPALSSDEIGTLGQAFETLRKKLEGKQYIEKYVHNLTHEIKSPLTGIIGAAELLRDPQLSIEDRKRLSANVEIEAHRLKDIAEKLLELASLEARAESPSVEKFDMRLLLEEVIESFAVQLKIRNQKIDLQCADSLQASGERFLIWRSVANLVQNAIEFTPDGSTISIQAKIDENYQIAVIDPGPGVPDFALEKLTEKFFSLERPRTGKKSSGLGLSFVAEVMRLHRGRLATQNHSGGFRADLIWS